MVSGFRITVSASAVRDVPSTSLLVHSANLKHATGLSTVPYLVPADARRSMPSMTWAFGRILLCPA